MKKYFGFIILVYIVFNIITAFVNPKKQSKFLVLYTWYKYNRVGDKRYSNVQQGGYLIDSTLKLTNGIDTIYLKIENH